MSVISISVTESSTQVVSGIPKSVVIETSVPSVIFYTLDGSNPTDLSDIYTSDLYLPTTQEVTLKIYATNGIDSSSVITEFYTTNLSGSNARVPHASTDAQASTSLDNLYPFGGANIDPNVAFINPGTSDKTVYDPALAAVSNGFNGFGVANNFTNKTFNEQNYQIKYSSTDANGAMGKLIGTLPASVTINRPAQPPPTTDQFSNTFDPRAFVIFQDLSKENPADPPQINRQFFSLEDPETTRAGNQFLNVGEDAPGPSGSFVRSFLNPRTNMMTYYYFDPTCSKWIISTSEYKPTGTFDGNLGGMVLPAKGKPGDKYVYEWIYGARRVLF